jgi:hypothetical protein
MEVELRLAEPRDVRLHGRQSTAVKLEVKLSASLETEIEIMVGWLEIGREKDAPDDGTLRIKNFLLQRKLVVSLVRKVPAARVTENKTANLFKISAHARVLHASRQVFAHAEGNISERGVDDGIKNCWNNDTKK